MKKIFSFLFFMFCTLIVLSMAHAKAPKWEFDRDHSMISFDVRHIYSITRGFFEDFSGHIFFDLNNIGESGCYFEVQVKSINTNIRKRDNHLRSDDFFAAGKYPLMTFKSELVRHVKANQYEIEGNLTVKDVTKQVVIPLTYLGTRESPFEKNRLVAGFEARFKIDRLEYNVGNGRFYQMGTIGKDVEVTISLEVLRIKK